MNNDDTAVIRKATEELNQVLQQVGTAAYQQSGSTGGETGEGPQGGPGCDEDVVEGEFRNA